MRQGTFALNLGRLARLEAYENRLSGIGVEVVAEPGPRESTAEALWY